MYNFFPLVLAFLRNQNFWGSYTQKGNIAFCGENYDWAKVDEVKLQAVPNRALCLDNQLGLDWSTAID